MTTMEEFEDAVMLLLLRSSAMMMASAKDDEEEKSITQEDVISNHHTIVNAQENIPIPSTISIQNDRAKRICLIKPKLTDNSEQRTPTKLKKRIWLKKWRDEKRAPEDFILANTVPSQYFSLYQKYLPINEQSFSEIISNIMDDICRRATVMRSPAPPELKLAATLRFLATGESFNALNYEIGYSNKFLSESVLEVCNAICNKMQDKYLKFPGTIEEWTRIADKFESRWDFPHCVGALDCKHIQFNPPRRERDDLFIPKSFNSVTLLALADADCKFTFVDIGRHGRASDAEVLERSHLIHIIRQGRLHLPLDAVVGNGRTLPYVIIADESFPLETHLMSPYRDVVGFPRKQIFNARLSHARQRVERAFGILCNKFRVLQTKILLNHEKVKRVVLCCCILHNFLMEKNKSYRERVLSQHEKDVIGVLEISSNKKAAKPTEHAVQGAPIRKLFTDYFLDEGRAVWQQNFVELNEVAQSLQSELI